MNYFSKKIKFCVLFIIIIFVQSFQLTAQTNDGLVIRLIGSQIYEVDFEQRLVEVSTEANSNLLDIGQFHVSNNGRYAIQWDEDISGYFNLIDLLTDEMILSELVIIRDNDFIDIDWLFDDQFAIIKTGKQVSVVDFANPINLVTQSWLVSTRSGAITDWYWNCNSIVHLIVTNELAYKYNRFDAAQELFQANQVFATIAGLEQLDYVEYQSVFQVFSEHQVLPSFTQSHDIVTFTDISQIPFETVSVYSTSSGLIELGTYNQVLEGVTRTIISPDGRFIAEIGSCNENTEISCLRIKEWVSNNDLIDTTDLGLENITNVTDVLWLQDSDEFIVAGNINNNLSGHLWHISLENGVLAELELNHSVWHIVGVQQST